MFRFAHNNLNVLDLERSKKFYAEALNLHELNCTIKVHVVYGMPNIPYWRR